MVSGVSDQMRRKCEGECLEKQPGVVDCRPAYDLSIQEIEAERL